MVHVLADYILDDHLKNSVFNIVFHEADEEISEFPRGDARRNPGMAVARIVGSADRLPWTVAGSARFT
jgi:hypothetical protein